MQVGQRRKEYILNKILTFHTFCLRFYSFVFFLTYLFIYLLSALGLRCYALAFSSCSEQGLLFVVVHGLLIAVASLVVEHRLYARGLQ